MARTQRVLFTRNFFRAALLPLTPAGCDPFGPGFCDLAAEPSVEVEVVDAESGAPVAEGARGAVREGTFVDSLKPQLAVPTGHFSHWLPGTHGPGPIASRYSGKVTLLGTGTAFGSAGAIVASRLRMSEPRRCRPSERSCLRPESRGLTYAAADERLRDRLMGALRQALRRPPV